MGDIRNQGHNKGDVAWSVQYRLRSELGSHERLRLLDAENPLTNEINYFVSNARLETPISSLLTVAFDAKSKTRRRQPDPLPALARSRPGSSVRAADYEESRRLETVREFAKRTGVLEA